MLLVRVFFFALGLSLGIWWVVAHHHAAVLDAPGSISTTVR